jgi:hypothetical protein
VRQLDQAWSNPELPPDRDTDFSAFLAWSAKFHRFRDDLRHEGGWERIDGFDDKLVAALRNVRVPASVHSPAPPSLPGRVAA